MFSKGTVVISKILTDYFKSIYRKINGLSNVQLRQMTSGQFQYNSSYEDSGGVDRDIVSDIMNVWSSQYFDRESQSYTDSAGSETLNYMRWYITRADELSENTTTGERGE